MLPLEITLTANAGVVLRCENFKLFSDALHRHKAENFSTLTPAMQLKMTSSPEFFGANVMVFTHKHPDHYSKTLIAAARQLMPQALLISPVPDFQDQLLLCEERHRISVSGAELDFLRLPHEGVRFADVANYGYLLTLGGKNILVTGDCAPAEPKLTEWLKNRETDLALLNFPWLTLKRGRDFITQVIKPKNVVFYHIPFESDDLCGFLPACRKALPLLDSRFSPRLLTEPFQTEQVPL